MQAAKLILGALPQLQNTPEEKQVFQLFMAAYEEALWKLGPSDCNHVASFRYCKHRMEAAFMLSRASCSRAR